MLEHLKNGKMPFFVRLVKEKDIGENVEHKNNGVGPHIQLTGKHKREWKNKNL